MSTPTAPITDSSTQSTPPAPTPSEEPATVSLNSSSTPNLVSTPQASPGEEASTKPVERDTKARLEFYQKIAQVDVVDEGI